MGCYIHLVLEKKDGQKWVGIDTFNGHHVAKWRVEKDKFDWFSPVARSRNYERFAALASVRGDGPAPKGLPFDASDTVALLSREWGGDGHSHSWVTLAEAVAIWLRTEHGELDDIAKKYPESYFFGVDSQNDGDEYRVVFWFDN